MSIRTVLVDDHPVFLEGMAVALGAKPDIDVVGSALTGQEGLTIIEEKAPDLVIVDFLLPDLTGPELLRRINAVRDDAVAIILTSSAEKDYVELAFEAGAAAFLRKELSIDELHGSISLVMRGYQIFPGEGTPTARSKPGALEGLIRAYGLTAGEIEILLLLASGKSNQMIARLREVSPQTIKNQTTSVYRKLGVASRTEAIVCALRAGVIPPE